MSPDDYVAQAPETQRRVFRSALAGTCSKRDAIKAKCLACCNYDRDEVRSCTVDICPLWRFRPYQARAKSTAEG